MIDKERFKEVLDSIEYLPNMFEYEDDRYWQAENTFAQELKELKNKYITFINNELR